MPNKKAKIAIIIPAFNESKSIGKVVKRLVRGCSDKRLNFKVIVVDDASNDKTSDYAREAGAHVVQHLVNVGAGGATATGLDYAVKHGFSYAITCDADGQHHPNDVLKGVELILKKDIDLLIGSRLINPIGMSRLKIWGNKILSHLSWIIYGVKVSDSQSGLRLFSKNALMKIYWEACDYSFCSEMLWRAKQSGLTIGEFPIKAIYSDYSISKGQNNWNGVHIMKSLLVRRLIGFFNE